MSGDAERTLAWPDGSIYVITRSTEETGGELLEMEWQLPPHCWAPRPHVHPELTEEYEVLEGRPSVMLDGEWRELAEGEAASVPPDTVHTFRGGDTPARIRNVHRPALDFEPYIRRLCRVANERDLGDLTGFRALLQVAVLLREFPRHSRAPTRALNAALPAAAALGRVLGFRVP